VRRNLSSVSCSIGSTRPGWLAWAYIRISETVEDTGSSRNWSARPANAWRPIRKVMPATSPFLPAWLLDERGVPWQAGGSTEQKR
jgi:hypothetical protein